MVGGRAGGNYIPIKMYLLYESLLYNTCVYIYRKQLLIIISRYLKYNYTEPINFYRLPPESIVSERNNNRSTNRSLINLKRYYNVPISLYKASTGFPNEPIVSAEYSGAEHSNCCFGSYLWLGGWFIIQQVIT